MPRRNAKPPYEIFSSTPPGKLATPVTTRHPSASGAGIDSSSSSAGSSGGGRGRRVLKLPEPQTVWAWCTALGRAIAEKSRASFEVAGERWQALRELWAQRREQRADRKAEAAANKVRPVESAAGAWWITSGKPVVLRMTRGLVVLGIAGVVGLVLLAYWLGRGDAVATNFAETWPDRVERPLAQADTGADVSGIDRQPPMVDVPGGSDPLTGVVVPTPRTTPPPAADPRVPGRNYLVYTMTDLGTARELADFLRGHDARIRLVPTEHRVKAGLDLDEHGVAFAGESSDTAVLHLVVDVTKGFTRAQYVRGEHHRFLSERLALGRAWKRHNGDRGSALESMTFYKYNAPSD